VSPTDVICPFSARAEEALRRECSRGTEPEGPAPELRCLEARTPEEVAIHLAIREAVFVGEQGFFESTDRDAHDESPSTIHVLGLSGRVAGGAVRLYELEEPGVWKGDRLAVLPPFRRRGLGGPLVRFAVAAAGARGGRLMIAHVQLPNVVFFEHLGWRPEGEPVEYVGRMHQLMAIDLSPGPAGSGGDGEAVGRRRAPAPRTQEHPGPEECG
jgi:putative N-acetyltransferase (TIGR04045 family)